SSLGTAKIAGIVEGASLAIAGGVTSIMVKGDVLDTDLSIGGAVGSIVPGITPGTYKVLGGLKIGGDVEDSSVSATGNVSILEIGGNLRDDSIVSATAGFGSIAGGALPGSIKLNGGVKVKGSVIDSTITT